MERDTSLTPGMEEAFVAVAYGVRKYADGYRSIETGEKVDGRSLDALYKRDLIYWESVGGHSPFISLKMTETGDTLFEEELRWRNEP